MAVTLKPRDIVRHKKHKHLERGRVTNISKSGKSTEVFWYDKENPGLACSYWQYYPVRLLEKVESDL